MNKTLKNKWIKALRSGKYEQGKGNLNHDGRYCCLGVLCEVAKRPYDLKDGYEFHVPWKLIDGTVDYGGLDGTVDDGRLYDAVCYLSGKYEPERVYVRDGKLYCSAAGAIPEFTAKTLGLNKRVKYRNNTITLQDKLVRLNDEDECNFNQIADYLEKVDF